jgi:hypothetical protein
MSKNSQRLLKKMKFIRKQIEVKKGRQRISVRFAALGVKEEIS